MKETSMNMSAIKVHTFCQVLPNIEVYLGCKFLILEQKSFHDCVNPGIIVIIRSLCV
jgi:hypothetical protein